MFYPPEVVAEVCALNDIVDVVGSYVPSLKPRSGNHFGVCPFHSEKTPSFSVNQEKQIFYCFGCGAGGNVITFVRKYENIDFVDALRFLADRVRYALPEKGTSPFAQETAKKQAVARELSAELNKRAALFFHRHLNSNSPDAVAAREYLEGRGVEPKLLKRFGLGLSKDSWDAVVEHLNDVSPDDVVAAGLATKSKKNAEKYYDRFRGRLMFPIIDSRSRVVGFGGRIMSDSDKNEAKYVNTPETLLFHKSDQLYGLNIARKARASELIVVEGYMDVLALHQAGFANTVGVLGTALNDSHARKLKQVQCKSVILILDSDEAGVRAALRAIPVLTNAELKVKVLNFTDAKDPDEFLQKHGAIAFAQLLANAKSHIAFRVGLLRNKFDLSNTDERVEFTQEAAKILSELASDIELDAYVREVAQASDISPNAIFAEVNKRRSVATEEKNIPRNPRALAPRVPERGLKDAKKGLLSLVLTSITAARALEKSKFLEPGEMGEEVYTKLLLLAFENAAKNIEQTPVDIINFFETSEDQQSVAEVFVTTHQYPSTEKALNDMANIIKRAWIKSQKLINNDLNALKTLQLLEKNLAKQYITMSDG